MANRSVEISPQRYARIGGAPYDKKMHYAVGMSRLHVCGAFLLALTLCPLRGEDPPSYQKMAATALQSEIAQIGRDCGNANTTLEEKQLSW